MMKLEEDSSAAGVEEAKKGILFKSGYSIRDEIVPWQWTKKLLNYYDDKKVGNDGEREPILSNAFHRWSERILPDELHLWTPAARRRLHGLGRTMLKEKRGPLKITLDSDAIERKRRREDDTNGMTHTKRRLDDLEEHQKKQVDPKHGNTANFWRLSEERRALTNEGLWISAAETSEDWITSYD